VTTSQHANRIASNLTIDFFLACSELKYLSPNISTLPVVQYNITTKCRAIYSLIQLQLKLQVELLFTSWRGRRQFLPIKALDRSCAFELFNLKRAISKKIRSDHFQPDSVHKSDSVGCDRVFTRNIDQTMIRFERA
jgi:hypothetical protein